MKLHGIFILLILAVVASGCGERVVQAPTPSIPSMPAPHFELPDLEGNKISSESLQGKIVILNFWAAWSPGSVREIPEWVALQNEYANKGVTFIGINVDNEGLAVARPYAEKHRINYPVLMGNMDMGADFGGLDGIPSTFIIDREWNVVNRYTSVATPAFIRAEINALLFLDRQKARGGFNSKPGSASKPGEDGPAPYAPKAEEKKEPETATPPPETPVPKISEPVES